LLSGDQTIHIYRRFGEEGFFGLEGLQRLIKLACLKVQVTNMGVIPGRHGLPADLASVPMLEILSCSSIDTLQSAYIA
jgi:hypothetical protein